MKSNFSRFIFFLLFVVAGLTYVHFEYETQRGNSKDKSRTVVYETPRIFKVPKNKTVEVKSSREAELRQVTTKKIMRDYCLTHKFEERPHSWGSVFVDDKFKIIYCAIPKVGSTALKKVLAKLHNKTFGETFAEHEKVHLWNGWRRLSQYPEKEREIRLKTYFKFLFIREPLHRLLSAFKNKFTQSSAPDAHPQYSRGFRNDIVKLYRPGDFKAGEENWITFSEFIKYYSSERYRDPHWLQYEKTCHPCFVNYNFVGHLETLEEDGDLLLKWAGIDNRVTFPKIQKQTSYDEVLDYYSQVPPEYINRIGEQYLSDFLMFGYEYLGPVKPLLNGIWPATQQRNQRNQTNLSTN